MGEWKPRAKFSDPTRLTRKVFDKHVDRMQDLRARDRADHRADFKAMFQRLNNLETQLLDLAVELQEQAEHIDRHCAELDTDRKDTRNS